ncbi:uncharacterized protein RHO25_011114 [Cercospora beticola]|uniref:NodB homology domain-containing protein n=1 Tax=Cercospora beticola TaxID=122368 RepID=A0ABZ0P3M1_CERBT|nr:hypothetical protein RHO25_011114 [Cercospora beticola]
MYRPAQHKVLWPGLDRNLGDRVGNPATHPRPRASACISHASKPDAVVSYIFADNKRSWTHANLTEASYDETVAEVSQIENWFANLFGFHPNFFRPPYGECPELCRSTLTELGYTIVNWNLDTQDWRYPDITSAFERMETIRVTEEELRVKEAPPIVLMHDPIESTAAVLLPAVLEYFSGLGYGFVSVAECLGTPREGWYRAVSYV